jgi:hypothetical protein
VCRQSRKIKGERERERVRGREGGREGVYQIEALKHGSGKSNNFQPGDRSKQTNAISRFFDKKIVEFVLLFLPISSIAHTQ